MDTDFTVKTGEFEGPLELLLELVEKRKLHINTISLSQVADDFIEHIKQHEEFPMNDSADFILIASTLLLIKSKSLLPTLDLTPEEEDSIEDLENRLALYKRYKELSQVLQKMFGDFLYFAGDKREKLVVFSPTVEITPDNLRNALSEALDNLPKRQEDLPKVAVKKVVSLEEMIERLSERVQKSLRGSFRDLAGISKADGSAYSPQEKIEVIVSFLAMLELVKQGIVRVSQEKHFEDIEIESENTGVPTYY